jgi:hypothetical protein
MRDAWVELWFEACGAEVGSNEDTGSILRYVEVVGLRVGEIA